MNRGRALLGVYCLFAVLCGGQVHADEISIPLSNGKQALADYRRGDAGKPAIFVLHGFLQTYRFSTVQLISDELSARGYTVLAPTLTLNIDQRRHGLDCETIQNHSVADSNREIGDWLGWLHAQGHTDVIAIGHSSGSMRLLSYLSDSPVALPSYFIAASIGPFWDWHNPQVTEQQLQAAQQRAISAPNQINGYTLAFCTNNYTAPAAAYLSYMQWDERWVLERLKHSPIPLQLVLGGGDKWLPPDWTDKVNQSGLPHTVLNDASHNFTGAEEFDFQELIVKLVAQAGAP